jgi:plastocyanin
MRSSAIMARDKPHLDDHEDALHHAADRPHDVFAGWIIVILMLLAAALAIGPGRLLDRSAEAPANPSPEIVHGTEDMLINDHTFAPAAIVVHPYDRIILRNVGKDPQQLALVGHENVLRDALQDASLEPGASFSFVIPPTLAPGTYRLLCTTHPNMSATLVMRARSGAEPTGSAPGALLRRGSIPARSDVPAASMGQAVPTERPSRWHSIREPGAAAIGRPPPLIGPR